jgi:hypothetical protein
MSTKIFTASCIIAASLSSVSAVSLSSMGGMPGMGSHIRQLFVVSKGDDTNYCPVATGTFYAYKDYCYGVKGQEWSNQATCWIGPEAKMCWPSGDWELIPNVGDNNCGSPCTDISWQYGSHGCIGQKCAEIGSGF